MINKKKIGILKLSNCGNINNLKNALEYCNAKVGFIETNDDFKNFDKIIIPGVGSFNSSMKNLNDQNIKNDLLHNIKKKITLGICIGMQLFSKSSNEIEVTEGLNIFNFEFEKIKSKKPLPVMGYNSIEIKTDNKLLKNVNSSDKFYFMHSYATNSSNYEIASAKYFDQEYSAVVAKENIFGVQFHIEKSKESGLKIINNFLNL